MSTKDCIDIDNLIAQVARDNYISDYKTAKYKSKRILILHKILITTVPMEVLSTRDKKQLEYISIKSKSIIASLDYFIECTKVAQRLSSVYIPYETAIALSLIKHQICDNALHIEKIARKYTTLFDSK